MFAWSELVILARSRLNTLSTFAFTVGLHFCFVLHARFC